MKRALLVLLPALASADDDPPMVGEETIRVDAASPYVVEGVSTSGMSTTTRTYRAFAKGILVASEPEVGAELRFLTSPALAFTDVMLLTLRGRVPLTTRADAFGAVDFLPKQPSTTDELIWQSASLGVNAAPWDTPIALHAEGNGGVLLDRNGYWAQAQLGAIARKPLHRIMQFEGGLTALGTRLLPDAGDSAWLVEAAVTGTLLVSDPQGWTGAWLGFHYALPLASAGAMLDPQPRVDVEIGAVLSFIDDWDVFARLAVIDRGEATQMATQLPILDGGSDQKQAVFGVTYHLH